MDKWTKYMADNESNLSIENVDEKVWHNINKAGMPKSRSFRKESRLVFEQLFKRYEPGRGLYTDKFRGYKTRLVCAVVLIAFVTVSCAYKVKSYATYGDVVSFAVAREHYLLSKDFASTNVFNSFSHIPSPSDADSLLFFQCFQNKDGKAKSMIRDLKVMKGIYNLDITPVVFEFRESLFSSWLSGLFHIQVSKADAGDKQLKLEVEEILKEKGLSSVDVQVDARSQKIIFNAEQAGTEVPAQSKADSVLLINTRQDTVKAAEKPDSSKPNSKLPVASKAPDAIHNKPGILMPAFDPVKYQKDLKLMNQLIDGLAKDGLIDRNKPYTVEIKAGELYVESKKQSKEVSDKFRKYFSGNNYAFIND